VAGVSIENMSLLDAPTIGSSAGDVRSTYEDQAFNVVTSVSGALGLLLYCVFVAGLFWLLFAGERRDPWSVVGLIGGIGGPVLAAGALAANGVLVADAGKGLSDDLTVTLHDLYLIARSVAGIFVALFVFGMSVAGVRSRILPARLGALGRAAGAVISLAPIAAFTGANGLEVAVSVAFGVVTLWVFLTSLWLLLGGSAGRATLLRRAAFVVLVLAAGLVGIALVAVPGATDTFFAWGLGPDPLAAFAGGVYLGAAALYAIALPAGWYRARSLVLGALVLSVSVFVVTLVHLEQFDLDRLQAWAWLVLFAGFALTMLSVLAGGDDAESWRGDVALPQPLRRALATIAAALGALAVALWIDPTGVGEAAPFDVPALGGRFAGCWIALLAVLLGHAALRNGLGEARVAMLALALLPAGALLGALRSIVSSDLHPAGTAAAYVGVLLALSAAGFAVLWSTRPSANATYRYNT
jgi:hypothetical protein